MPRKSVPKKTMKRAMKRVAKRKAKQARKAKDTFFLRTRVVGTMTPLQGVTVANYISYFWKLLDQYSVVGVTQSSEFQLFASLYDRVRVNRIRVRVIPKANMLDQVGAQNDAALNVTGDGKVHTILANEQEAYSTSIPRLQRSTGYRAYSVLKPFTRSYGITYPKGVWLNAQNIYEDNTLLSRLGATGGIGVYAENLLEENLEVFNEPWAALEIDYDCVFQAKIGPALKLDDSGAICVTKPSVSTVAFSPINAISGTFADTRVTGFDLSGQIVEVPKGDDSEP